jgi:hypothetical protein
MNEFLRFRLMITPIIIEIIFWIGVGLMALMGLFWIFTALTRYGSGLNAIVGLLTLILGPIYWRVTCEIIIVLFRINEKLSDIRDNTAGGPAGGGHHTPQPQSYQAPQSGSMFGGGGPGSAPPRRNG